jgi:hypothetical protein
MAKENVIIFDGEDKFITKKNHVYNKNKGLAEYVSAAALNPDSSLPPKDPSVENPTMTYGSSGNVDAPRIGNPEEQIPIGTPSGPSPIISDPSLTQNPIPTPPIGGGGSIVIPEPTNPKQCGPGFSYSYAINKCIPITDIEDVPNCGSGYLWDASKQLCMPIGNTPTTTTTTTTSTTTTTTTASSGGGGGNVIIPGLGIAPGGGGGGGGSSPDEEVPKEAPIVEKNYFWYYVAGGALGFYLLKKFLN